MTRNTRLAAVSVVTLFLAALSPSLLAHGDEARAGTARTDISTEKHAFGVEGDPKKAGRKIAISMDDGMHYSPAAIRVAQGETVTFVISNKGKLLHELVIGTEKELREHAELMRKFPGMEHDEPYMAHVKPGTEETITWKFTNAGTFQFGCMVAGHYEAGMKGKIVVAGGK